MKLQDLLLKMAAKKDRLRPFVDSPKRRNENTQRPWHRTGRSKLRTSAFLSQPAFPSGIGENARIVQ